MIETTTREDLVQTVKATDKVDMARADIMALQDSKTHRWEEWQDTIHLRQCMDTPRRLDIRLTTMPHRQEYTLLGRLNKDILLVPMEVWVNRMAVGWEVGCTVRVEHTRCQQEGRS